MGIECQITLGVDMLETDFVPIPNNLPKILLKLSFIELILNLDITLQLLNLILLLILSRIGLYKVSQILLSFLLHWQYNLEQRLLELDVCLFPI